MQIAKKYAQLLFDEASRAKILNKVSDEISALSGAIFLHHEVAYGLTSPIVKNKAEILLEKVLNRYKITPLVSHFLRILVRNKRLADLASIAEAYNNLIETMDGTKVVGVISSKKRLPVDESKILKLLERSLVTDKISVKYTTDPSIIGGIVIKYDSTVIDASIRGALKMSFRTEGVLG